MTKSKSAKAADAEPVADGKVRIYPTHRLSAGPLRIALPSVDGHSDELVVDDDGADVDEAIAQHAVAFRDATTEKPEE